MICYTLQVDYHLNFKFILIVQVSRCCKVIFSPMCFSFSPPNIGNIDSLKWQSTNHAIKKIFRHRFKIFYNRRRSKYNIYSQFSWRAHICGLWWNYRNIYPKLSVENGGGSRSISLTKPMKGNCGKLWKVKTLIETRWLW